MDNLLESIAVFIPAGESRVVLNFSVKPGYGYKLFSKTPYLWRDTIPSFSPYRISNIIELYGTGQDKYYPYMYDWEIVTEANKTCESIRQVVFAQVGNRHLLSITGLDTVYRNTDSAVTMTGVPPGGVFFGAGVNGNTFDPSLAGIGTHTVKYAYMDELGCTDSTLLQVTVNSSQSVNQADSLYPIFNVFSNPSSGLFTMKVKSVEPYKIAVYDIMGNQIKDKTSFVNTGELTLDLREFPQGIYTVGIMTKNHSAQKKIIVN
ncbi:MAG: T9SS type A sorting domain-containing protein [Bacteroidetes bacterium]|nr:T9SS type A sorting domain-containing protein [Bacteroidota bacterium]